MSLAKKTAKVMLFTSLFLFSIVICFAIYVSEVLVLTAPPTEIKVAGDGEGSLIKNKWGVWEMYLKGSPYDRGVKYGELGLDLIQKQEGVFVDQINHFVPNTLFQKFLKILIGIFNRNIVDHIPEEFLHELYGVSHAFNPDYNYISSGFMRILNYHAAHDLGHALNDYSIVGCTSFGVLDTSNGEESLLIGRNFDFYVGDDFSQEKLLLFLDPKDGYSFASYSWAGFMGVASGMNEKGLSVTINSARSSPPTSAKTPISILAREILQYSKNIEEAISIALKREVFVSEVIMVGSSEDGSIALIEKSPSKMGVYHMEGNRIICSNHFQSSTFKEDDMNVLNIKSSESMSRYERVRELIPENGKISLEGAVAVLRDQHGAGGDTLGMGNPQAINQLISHHSVVFDNNNTTIYVSTSDWQLGSYVGYDLKNVFETGEINVIDTVPASLFLKSNNFESFITFKRISKQILDCTYSGTSLDSETINDFINSNSESYMTYELLGDYYLRRGEVKPADMMFNLSLTKNLPSLQVKEGIDDKISSDSK